jgi:signal transduction histidine kinase
VKDIPARHPYSSSMESRAATRAESEKMTALIQLAGTVAHELNNIFTAVAGNLSLLDQQAFSSNSHALTVQDVVRAAQRGIDLTAKLQAFAGRQQLNRRSIEVNSVVARTVARMRLGLGATAIQSTLAEGEFVVYADEQKLSDTIMELIKNAQAAMQTGPGRLTVKTERRLLNNRAPYVLLSVGDNGCGMTPEVAARATEPLFTTHPHGVRAGWGLSNCAGFIRQSGGYMRLTSNPGEGTLVEILLPLENG